jgi:hypothetical protein
MFANSISVNDGLGSAVALSLIDTDDGKSVRAINLGGGNKLELILSRTDSTENKGVLSDRYLVRMDRTLIESASPYAAAKISAYLVLVVPRRPDATEALVLDTLTDLLDFILQGEGTGFVAPEGPNDLRELVSNQLTRILTGEV